MRAPKVDGKQDEVKQHTQAAADSKKPSYELAPSDTEFVTKCRLSSEGKEAQGLPGIMSHVPPQPCETSGNYEHQKMCESGPHTQRF
jgi:hypothetical protein